MATDGASSRTGLRAARASFAVCLFLLGPAAAPTILIASAKSDLKRQIQFGTQMAKEGNWREAIFRWQRALTIDPSNARVHNNLAVAYESLGEYAKAETEYLAALTGTDAPSEIHENYELFKAFYARYKEIALSPESPTLAEPKAPDAKP